MGTVGFPLMGICRRWRWRAGKPSYKDNWWDILAAPAIPLDHIYIWRSIMTGMPGSVVNALQSRLGRNIGDRKCVIGDIIHPLAHAALFTFVSDNRALLDLFTKFPALQSKYHVGSTFKESYIFFPTYTAFAMLQANKLLFHFPATRWADLR